MSIQFFKKLLPKSISSRFVLILIAPIIFSQLIFEYIFFGRHTETIINCVSTIIAGDIKVLTDLMDSNNLTFAKCREISNIMEIDVDTIKNSNFSQPHKKRNNRIYKSINRALLSKGIHEFYVKPFDRKIWIYVNSQKNNTVYKFSFLKKKIYSRTIPIVILWGVSSAIILLIIAFIFLKNQIRPIKRLAIAMEDFGNGNDNNKYKEEGATEVRVAWMSFFNMKTNFKKVMDDRMNTLAGISHDLKTPLTRMRLQLALMPRNDETKDLLEDIVMMTKITDSFILHASKINNESFNYQNLSIFLERIIKKYNFPIEIYGDKAIEIFLKHVSFKRVIENIISNATKYATKLYINFFETKDSIFINFEDNGSGIDPFILNDIFSPFFSGNRARTKDLSSPNVGLGLNIARNIVLDHGGEINAENSEQYHGAKISIRIPRMRT